MSRQFVAAAAQMGPIALSETRPQVVQRLLALLREAHGRGAKMVVFPELALTTFFPRWMFDDQADVDAFFEGDMPGKDAQPLFDEAKALGVGFYLGFAEKIEEGGRMRRFNTAIIVAPDGSLVGKYRKVHLPGHADFDSHLRWQHLEKRYFEPGDLGFPVWRSMDANLGMCICNDRRWPETYRVMGLQDVEVVMLGYNTPVENQHTPDEPPELRMFHNQMSMQAGAYQNGTWVVGVAKCGVEDGHDLMAGSVIVSPDGVIVAEAKTREDELIVADCDLDKCTLNKTTIFNFAAHRRPEHYGLIVERTGAEPPTGAPPAAE